MTSLVLKPGQLWQERDGTLLTIVGIENVWAYSFERSVECYAVSPHMRGCVVSVKALSFVNASMTLLNG